jgi:hypothetical protein
MPLIKTLSTENHSIEYYNPTEYPAMVPWFHLTDVFETIVFDFVTKITGQSRPSMQHLGISQNLNISESYKIWSCETNSTLEMYVVVGNHDVLDGGAVIVENILDRANLGVWNLPQNREYFFLPLENSLVLLGIFDQHAAGSNADIDSAQYWYFFDRIQQFSHKYAIIATHAPWWLNGGPGPRLQQLMDMLHHHKLIIVACIAGDLHYYSRLTPANGYPHFIVSGGGGAFKHSTANLADTFDFKFKINGAVVGHVLNQKSYPNTTQSMEIASRIYNLSNYLDIQLWLFSLIFLVVLLFLNWVLTNDSILRTITAETEAKQLLRNTQKKAAACFEDCNPFIDVKKGATTLMENCQTLLEEFGDDLDDFLNLEPNSKKEIRDIPVYLNKIQEGNLHMILNPNPQWLESVNLLLETLGKLEDYEEKRNALSLQVRQLKTNIEPLLPIFHLQAEINHISEAETGVGIVHKSIHSYTTARRAPIVVLVIVLGGLLLLYNWSTLTASNSDSFEELWKYSSPSFLGLILGTVVIWIFYSLLENIANSLIRDPGLSTDLLAHAHGFLYLILADTNTLWILSPFYVIYFPIMVDRYVSPPLTDKQILVCIAFLSGLLVVLHVLVRPSDCIGMYLFVIGLGSSILVIIYENLSSVSNRFFIFCFIWSMAILPTLFYYHFKVSTPMWFWTIFLLASFTVHYVWFRDTTQQGPGNKQELNGGILKPDESSSDAGDQEENPVKSQPSKALVKCPPNKTEKLEESSSDADDQEENPKKFFVALFFSLVVAIVKLLIYALVGTSEISDNFTSTIILFGFLIVNEITGIFVLIGHYNVLSYKMPAWKNFSYVLLVVFSVIFVVICLHTCFALLEYKWQNSLWLDGYSFLGVAEYNSFLRLSLENDTLRIYCIGMDSFFKNSIQDSFHWAWNGALNVSYLTPTWDINQNVTLVDEILIKFPL